MSPTEAPQEFLEATASLRGHTFRPDMHVVQIPPPENIAPWAVALQAETDVPSVTALPYRAGSRFIVLYDEENIDIWGGPLRIVVHMGVPMDSVMSEEELLGGVAWTWLTEAMKNRQAHNSNMVGTVTRIHNTSFAGIQEQNTSTELELRASWTAEETDISGHMLAWIDTLAHLAGLGPEGATQLRPRR